MAEAKPGLGEKAINKIAEMALGSQLEDAEKLQVDVKIDPNNLAKGEVDSLTIEGEGLVTPQDMHVAELEMHINNIAVNPLNALFGKIQLTKPSEGTARVVLTETDINHTLQSKTVSRNNQKLVSIDGQHRLIDIQQIESSLQADGKIALSADISLPELEETKHVSLLIVPSISSSSEVVIQNIQYLKGEEISPELTADLVDRVSEILNIRSFEIEGVSLSIRQVDVEAGKVTLFATAVVTQLPKT